jgi:excisionase family DNA binding protein
LPDTANGSRYLNTTEIAADMRLHIKTVRNMCESGEIPAVKLAGRWYVTRENLDKLLGGRTVTIDPAIEAARARWEDEPPPPALSERQKDLIAGAFDSALRPAGKDIRPNGQRQSP